MNKTPQEDDLLEYLLMTNSLDQTTPPTKIKEIKPNEVVQGYLDLINTPPKDRGFQELRKYFRTHILNNQENLKNYVSIVLSKHNPPKPDRITDLLLALVCILSVFFYMYLSK